MRLDHDTPTRQRIPRPSLKSVRDRVAQTRETIVRFVDKDLAEAMIAASTYGFAFKLRTFQNTPSFSVARAARAYGVSDYWLQSVWWITAGAIIVVVFSPRLELRRAVMVWAAVLWSVVAAVLYFFPQNSAYDIMAGINATFSWIVILRLTRRIRVYRALVALQHTIHEEPATEKEAP